MKLPHYSTLFDIAIGGAFGGLIIMSFGAFTSTTLLIILGSCTITLCMLAVVLMIIL